VPRLQPLLDTQAPDLLHQQEDLIAPRLYVFGDLVELQLCKVLRP